MSTDLTFITNEIGTTLLDRFNVLLKEDTRFFDCLVGYFFISGFYKLYPSLEGTEKIRILIGLKTDRMTQEFIEEGLQQKVLDYTSHAEAKEKVPSEILKELDTSNDSTEIETGIKKFVEWIGIGKLEIKAYPTENIHAKVYIMTFHEGDRDKGRVITGSSNFSQSGLRDNLEFNVELKNASDYEFAHNKFEELWKDAVNVSQEYVDTIQNKSPFAHFTPYELYLKFLYEYFKRELSVADRLISPYLPINFIQLKYQDDAVMSAKKILEEYGGVFISDVVGLGKTFMAAMLAQQLDGRTLVLAPPALLDENNPGSWPNVFGDFRTPADFKSIGKLDDLLRRGVEKYQNVFVDEAHRFRTEATQTYEKLAQICRGKRVILVTATPLNNTPRDILSQIKLFQNGRNSTIPNVRDLEGFFTRLEKKLRGLDRKENSEEYLRVVRQNAKEIRENVLKYLMVRRTRSEIARYYADDLREQNLKFPEVAEPKQLFYQFNNDESEIFTETISLLTKKFTYARYKPLEYYIGTPREQNELLAQKNLAKFMKILLVKRLESSFYAFNLSIERFIGSYERFIEEFIKGDVYISKKHIHKIFEFLDDDNAEAVQQLIEEDKAERLAAKDFKDEFLADLKQDLTVLKEIATLWQRIRRDPKWEHFKSEIKKDPVLRDNKLVIFTESKETASYLSAALEKDLSEKVVLFTGDSNPRYREIIIENFDARAFRRKDDYRILVSTEVLAEGVNLHRANVVINYDIPWNPTRLIQRVGRVNRIDTTFDTIHTYNFFPTDEGDDQIKLTHSARSKIQSFIEMLGADAKLLTEGEEIKTHDLFTALNSRKTITGEDENEASELEYLKVIRDLRKNNPDLFERIKRLPKKARSAKSHQCNAHSLVTYVRKGHLEKFFLAGTDAPSAKEVDFFEAVKILKSEPADQSRAIGKMFYDLLTKNKQAFVVATTEELIAGEGTPPRDKASHILKRLKAREIRFYKGFTEEDRSFIKRVIELLEDGALPKPTTKKLHESLSTELEPLKVLGILKRDIPAEFFKATRAQESRHYGSPREVILSEYLVTNE
ncbi:MAG: helicase [Deltaproteobacteria bacterium]|nr:helicase [Deltaproteobacteria bacterium]